MKLSIFSMNRPPEEAPNTPPPSSESRPAEEPKSQPVVVGQFTSIKEIRAHVLDSLFVFGCVLSTLTLAVKLPSIIQNARWLTLALYAATVAVLVFFTFQRQVRYSVRSIIVCLTLYFVGVSILVNEGLYGGGRVFLLALALIATMLSGERSRVGITMLAITTLLVVGGLMVAGLIPAPVLGPDAGNASLASWLMAAFSFAVATVALVFSLGILLQGLEKSQERQYLLMGELRRERAALEQRVQNRTHALERRLGQIRAAAEITRATSRELDLQNLLLQVCELVQERFGLYYVGVFLIEGGEGAGQSGEARYATLAAGSGEAGRRMMAERHRLLVGGDSMIGWATANRQPRIALDTGKEATRFNNPNLPRTRSELALPIMVGSERLPRRKEPAERKDGEPVWGQSRRETTPDSEEWARRLESEPPESGRVLGAMTIQSDQESAFDQDDIIVLQGIADGLANAIENARLFAATQASLEEVSALHRQYLQNVWGETQSVHGELSYSYQAAAAAPGSDAPQDAQPAGDQALHVPIRLRDQVIGSLVLEPGENSAGWTAAQRQLVEAVTAQAALALENARLLEETRRRAEQERATSEITSKLWTTSDLDNILRTVLKELAGSLNASEGWVEIWPGGESAAPARITEAGDVDN